MPSRPPSRPAPDRGVTETLRLVSFGTSLSARGGWQAALAARLRERLEADATIAIHAKPGANSDWGVANAATVAALDADIVLIEFSINDASLLRGVSLSRSRENLRKIVATLKASAPSPRLVLMTMNPALGLKRLVRPRLDAYYAVYLQVAAELGLGVAHLYQAWAALSPRQLRRAIPDGLHPLPDPAADIIVPALTQLITQGEVLRVSGRHAAPAR